MYNNIKINNNYLTIKDEEISRELIFNSVYSFVSKLPYSMDPYSKDYMPGDLYNHVPSIGSVLKNPSSDFEYSSLFMEMKTWVDTRKSSYVIQLCYIFQLMLTYDVKLDFLDDNTLIDVWGVSFEYSKLINDTMKKFPNILEKIKNSINQEERNLYLEEVYNEIKKTFDRFKPKDDLKMFYYFNQIDYDLISIEQMEKYLVDNSKMLTLNMNRK